MIDGKPLLNPLSLKRLQHVTYDCATMERHEHVFE